MISFSLPFRDCIISARLEWASGFSDCNEWKCIRILLIILAPLTQVELRVLWYSYPLRPFLTGEGIIWSCKDEMWLCFCSPFSTLLVCLPEGFFSSPPPSTFSCIVLYYVCLKSNLSLLCLVYFLWFLYFKREAGPLLFHPLPGREKKIQQQYSFRITEGGSFIIG